MYHDLVSHRFTFKFNIVLLCRNYFPDYVYVDRTFINATRADKNV